MPKLIVNFVDTPDVAAGVGCHCAHKFRNGGCFNRKRGRSSRFFMEVLSGVYRIFVCKRIMST